MAICFYEITVIVLGSNPAFYRQGSAVVSRKVVTHHCVVKTPNVLSSINLELGNGGVFRRILVWLMLGLGLPKRARLMRIGEPAPIKGIGAGPSTTKPMLTKSRALRNHRAIVAMDWLTAHGICV